MKFSTAQSTALSLPFALAESRRRIDAALDQYSRFDAGCPERLGEAIRYCLLAPGKRLRPTLVLWAAEACGCSVEAALPAACAVEMVHTYSLVHDDLPAMDDDDLRRGRATCHKVYGEANAILVGDALQALAFEVLAAGIRPAEKAVACIATLAHAAGATALVGGQADDLARQTAENDLPPRDRPQRDRPSLDLAALESIHERKTGAMFHASLRLGGLIAAADPRRQAALEAFGRKLGLAFQIIDDLLDVEGEEAAVGKRLGKDSNRGKLTFPAVLGLDESRRYARQTIDEAVAALAPLAPADERLASMARFVLERNQ
ncbi:MAG TPA: farnesyl diphosphate synthase [Pirellulales bacterium]|nr:farnesyl diphosphate synthase [Pirellulales bacterium]